VNNEKIFNITHSKSTGRFQRQTATLKMYCLFCKTKLSAVWFELIRLNEQAL